MPATKPAVNIITRDGLPALNVKVYGLPLWPDEKDLLARHGITQYQAEKALETLWNHAVEEFWNDVDGVASEHFGSGDNISAYAEGRSGGWVVVEGLGDVAAWTVKQRRQWARFQKDIEGAIAYRSGAEWANEELTEILEWRREQDAQERIHQAGPQLLAALKRLVGAPDVCLESLEQETIDAVEQADTAIADAEGSAA